MGLLQRTATALDRLGNTADEVAMTLKATGITGVRHTARFLNPIVRYVQTEIREPRNMDVIKGDRLSITFPDGRKEEVPLPKAVMEFHDAFNRGTYLDLLSRVDEL